MFRAFSHAKVILSPLSKARPASAAWASTAASKTNGNGAPLPTQADAVIIGGGVAGCSLIYHLAKLGMSNVVMLEKDDITAGTTWHTAGLVWHLRPSDTEVELLNYSWDLMKGLEADTGVNTGYIQNGGLFIAGTKERLDEYQRLGSLGKVFGIESHVLGPKETKELYPLMNVDNVYGSLYSPTDGTIDPNGYCMSLLRGATRDGAKYFTGVAVRDVETAEDAAGTRRVKAVVTSQGRIETPIVVNCAGAWSHGLGQMAGVSVPLCAMRHAYVITDRIEGVQNMPNIRDHDASVYLRLQGDALSIGGYENNPIFWDPEPNFAFSLFELDWDVFSVHIAGAVQLVPAVESTGIKSTVCGPESFTPDHKPLMGESPELRGFYLNCGYNSAGMMLSGGCGREMAAWIVRGRPQLDMFGYDIRRFSPILTSNWDWIRQTSHEAYAKNYSIVYPHDEPLAGRNQIKGALYETLRDKGCFYQQRQGFERPGWYADTDVRPKEYDYYGNYGIEAHADYPYRDHLTLDYTFDFPRQHDTIATECLAAREAVAVFDMSYFGKYYLVGPDAEEAADWLFTANVRRPIGQTAYSCVLNAFGGTESDLTVSVVAPGAGGAHAPQFEGERGYYLAVGGAVSTYVVSYLRDIIQDRGWRCSLVDHSHDMSLISVQGPCSRAVLQALSEDPQVFSDEAFPFSSHKEVLLAGLPCRALRLTFVGELGWELHVPNEFAVGLYNAVMEAGARFGIKDAGYRAIDCLSLEKGYRHWHADLRSDDSPLEAGLGFACKLKTDIPFLGREALEKQKAEGVRKKIALFEMAEPLQLHGLEPILRDGQFVGHLRRAEFAHFLGKSIAYGYVQRPDGGPVKNDFLKSGEWEIERMGVRHKASAHVKSLFDPKNLRVKGQYEEADVGAKASSPSAT